MLYKLYCLVPLHALSALSNGVITLVWDQKLIVRTARKVVFFLFPPLFLIPEEGKHTISL